MKTKLPFLLLCIGLFLTACMQKEKTCVIKGTVINRPQSTQLRLVKAFVDFRSKSAVLIPIVDGSFRHEIKYRDVEGYTLVFEDEHKQGNMRPITFFTSEDSITMELYPMQEFEKNTIDGGEENRQFAQYEKKKMGEYMERTQPIQDSMRHLREAGKYHSQIMKDLFVKLENTEQQDEKYKMYGQINELYKSGEGLTPEANELKAQRSAVFKDIQNKELDYLSKNGSISAYHTLIMAITQSSYSPDMYDFEKLSSLQKKYAAKYKYHPYTRYSNEVLWRFANMKPGGKFFDFTLPDLNGNEYTLSEEIKGKYAFIDIWAPWCGPCIAKGRKMKPVYESYKDKGFTVVGVASKYRELADVEKRLEEDQYQWITLIDQPERDSRIKEHYGTEMAGGGCILVDKEGKVVLVNPTVEEVEKVLATNL